MQRRQLPYLDVRSDFLVIVFILFCFMSSFYSWKLCFSISIYIVELRTRIKNFNVQVYVTNVPSALTGKELKSRINAQYGMVCGSIFLYFFKFIR